MRLISAARLLSKWDQIGLLLDRSLQAADDERATLATELARWASVVANRSFVRATDEQRQQLVRALDLLRHRAPASIWTTVAVMF